jgi:hypothetical protein
MRTKTLEARLRFLTSSGGGRSTPALSGIRPHLKLGETLTSCIVRSREAIEVFDLGIDYDVRIEIPFWDEYGRLFSCDAPVELFDGERLIARGTWAR